MVYTNIKLAAAFPTDHPLHGAAPGPYLTDEAREWVRGADVILSLDYLDLAGTLKQAFGNTPVQAKVIQVSCDQHSHRGWAADYFGLPPIDVYLMCESDAAVPLLLDAVSARTGKPAFEPGPALKPPPDAVSLRGVGLALEEATRGIDVCYTRFPLGWNGAYTHFRHPLDYIVRAVIAVVKQADVPAATHAGQEANQRTRPLGELEAVEDFVDRGG